MDKPIPSEMVEVCAKAHWEASRKERHCEGFIDDAETAWKRYPELKRDCIAGVRASLTAAGVPGLLAHAATLEGLLRNVVLSNIEYVKDSMILLLDGSPRCPHDVDECSVIACDTEHLDDWLDEMRETLTAIRQALKGGCGDE